MSGTRDKVRAWAGNPTSTELVVSAVITASVAFAVLRLWAATGTGRLSVAGLALLVAGASALFVLVVRLVTARRR